MQQRQLGVNTGGAQRGYCAPDLRGQPVVRLLHGVLSSSRDVGRTRLLMRRARLKRKKIFETSNEPIRSLRTISAHAAGGLSISSSTPSSSRVRVPSRQLRNLVFVADEDLVQVGDLALDDPPLVDPAVALQQHTIDVQLEAALEGRRRQLAATPKLKETGPPPERLVGELAGLPGHRQGQRLLRDEPPGHQSAPNSAGGTVARARSSRRGSARRL